MFTKVKEGICLSRQLYGPTGHLDMSYSFASTLLRKIADAELLTFDKVGRRNNIKVTDKGKEVQTHMLEIMKILKEAKNV